MAQGSTGVSLIAYFFLFSDKIFSCIRHKVKNRKKSKVIVVEAQIR